MIDAWAAAAGIADGRVFRSVNRGGDIQGTALSEKVDWQLIWPTRRLALLESRPRLLSDPRKVVLCGGRELEQVQLIARL